VFGGQNSRKSAPSLALVDRLKFGWIAAAAISVLPKLRADGSRGERRRRACLLRRRKDGAFGDSRLRRNFWGFACGPPPDSGRKVCARIPGLCTWKRMRGGDFSLRWGFSYHASCSCGTERQRVPGETSRNGSFEAPRPGGWDPMERVED
jgi:hypothetical protein